MENETAEERPEWLQLTIATPAPNDTTITESINDTNMRTILFIPFPVGITNIRPLIHTDTRTAKVYVFLELCLPEV